MKTGVAIAIVGVVLLIAWAASLDGTLSGQDLVQAPGQQPVVQGVIQERASREHPNIPFLQKKPDFGGEACVAMVLRGMGHPVDQDFVFNASGIDPTLARGLIAKELKATVERLGFQPGPSWYVWNAEQYEAFCRRLTEQTETGTASLFRVRENGTECFVLVLGVDERTGQVIFHDPNRENGAYRKRSLREFFDACRLDGERFVKIDLDLDAKLTIKPTLNRHSNADYAQHIRKLNKRLPGPNFKIILQRPFVVIGDESREQVRARSIQTVQWAVDLLKQDYFKKDPNQIIDVWLFKDRQSYESNCMKLFGSKPGTPYGYYSPRHRALVMNISTGGGTLVHEIVHPFIESNFPACPSWFNEGLASLYEQSAGRNRKIVGLTNWRLRGLQMAIRSKRLGSFKELCETTRRQFYDDPNGTHYSQARYLCYYLQEKGLLRTYYREFSANVANDPSGYQTLQRVLGVSDMDDFQIEWEAFVMKLRFGN